MKPEILDALPADNPEAVRSRRDLRLINFFMGNERWIKRRVAGLEPRHLTELGAGEGHLCRALAKGSEVTAYDLAPRPDSAGEEVTWVQGDLFEHLDGLEGDCLVACLFLHHFEAAELERLAAAVAGFPYLIFCEPHRSRFAHMLGLTAWPFVNRVTRHDMHVSITAGFRRGELPGLFPSHEWSEKKTLMGGLRSEGRRL